MAGCQRCFIVPPHLLKALASSAEVPEETREFAAAALAHCSELLTGRKESIAALARSSAPRRSIIPDHILKSIADSNDVDDETRDCAKRDLEHLALVHGQVHEAQAEESQKRLAAAAAPAEAAGPATPLKVYRIVYDAENRQSERYLPGKQVRVEGQKPVADGPANQAYDNVGLVLQMYSEFFDWKSIDNKNMHVKSTVHFGRNYQNAFWDPQRRQMVFGDGGELIHNFTTAIDVIGHEMTHAVTEYTSPLEYQGQSGALNEHVSDVFGIMIKQWREKEKAADADWLIGEECLVPSVKGIALRSMKAPGSAYDDPRFGKDPQPDNFKDYEVMFEDNGGVHIYSGIPNKAFYLSALSFGGNSWEKAGQIWWDTMRSGKIPEDCTFLQFAQTTVEVAGKKFGDDAAAVVRQAWEAVGVLEPDSDDGKDKKGKKVPDDGGDAGDDDGKDDDEDDDDNDDGGCGGALKRP